MKHFILSVLALMPVFVEARNLNQSSEVEPDSLPQVYDYNIKIDTIETMIIRPGEAPNEMLYKETPVEKVVITKKGYSSVYLVDSQQGTGRGFELRLTGGLYKGIGEFVDTNASMVVEGVFNVNHDWGFGVETGLVYSATRYGVNFIPVVGLVDFYLDPMGGFVPFCEFYGGALIGIGHSAVIDKDKSNPNCGIIGGKLGCAYNFKCNISLRAAVDYFHTMDNGHKTYGDTSVSCLGPSGSICYKF